MEGYISAREASYKWGVSERRVHQYCQNGRIPGVTRFGRSWVIPSDAEKPADPRRVRTENNCVNNDWVRRIRNERRNFQKKES